MGINKLHQYAAGRVEKRRVGQFRVTGGDDKTADERVALDSIQAVVRARGASEGLCDGGDRFRRRGEVNGGYPDGQANRFVSERGRDRFSQGRR